MQSLNPEAVTWDSKAKQFISLDLIIILGEIILFLFSGEEVSSIVCFLASEIIHYWDKNQ